MLFLLIGTPGSHRGVCGRKVIKITMRSAAVLPRGGVRSVGEGGERVRRGREGGRAPANGAASRTTPLHLAALVLIH